MDAKYKISVIVPVYNAEKYLEETVKSLINQTMNEIEIIFVNDGSTDNSLNILNKYKKENVKIINQSNKGVIEARIVGFNQATGNYITFVDNDDILDKDMYKKMYSKAKEENADVVICNYSFYPKAVKTKGKWFKEYKGIKDWHFIERNTLLWNKIVKKELLEKVNIVELFRKIGEGSYTNVLLEADKIVTINEELYHYRVGHQSLSTNFKNMEWYKNNLKRQCNHYEIIPKNEKYLNWKEYFNHKINYAIIQLLIICSYNSDKDEYKKYQKQLKERKYRKNNLSIKILKDNYGALKAYVLFYLMPNSYIIAKAISKMFFE